MAPRLPKDAGALGSVPRMAMASRPRGWTRSARSATEVQASSRPLIRQARPLSSSCKRAPSMDRQVSDRRRARRRVQPEPRSVDILTRRSWAGSHGADMLASVEGRDRRDCPALRATRPMARSSHLPKPRGADDPKLKDRLSAWNVSTVRDEDGPPDLDSMASILGGPRRFRRAHHPELARGSSGDGTRAPVLRGPSEHATRRAGSRRAGCPGDPAGAVRPDARQGRRADPQRVLSFSLSTRRRARSHRASDVRPRRRPPSDVLRADHPAPRARRGRRALRGRARCSRSTRATSSARR
ncbi:MAG: hypothetical protein K0S65_3735 [Labilithrix sp.]|nr:hypothetical protein [Labilithrix sp.]